MEQIEAGQFIQDLKMNVLQAIQYIIQAWNEITTETISNCWNHTKILLNTEHLNDIEDADIERDDIETDDYVLDEISKMLEILNLPNLMKAEEFLNIPEERVVYEVPDDITGFIEMFKKKSDENADERDDSTEVVKISSNAALEGLNIVHTFLLQQENSNEYMKLVNSIEKFIRRKQTQTTIHQYFG